MRRAGLVILATTLLLGACGQPTLRDLRPPGDGPDEFLIVPVLPLQEPPSYSELPPPTPGSANITDPRPMADATAALGGRLDSPSAPVPGADAGLVAYASRNGTAPNIRATLAEEDADFRRRKARFTNIRLFPEDRYDRAYRSQALPALEVALRYEQVGIPVPSAPLSGD